MLEEVIKLFHRSRYDRRDPISHSVVMYRMRPGPIRRTESSLELGNFCIVARDRNC